MTTITTTTAKMKNNLTGLLSRGNSLRKRLGSGNNMDMPFAGHQLIIDDGEDDDDSLPSLGSTTQEGNNSLVENIGRLSKMHRLDDEDVSLHPEFVAFEDCEEIIRKNGGSCSQLSFNDSKADPSELPVMVCDMTMENSVQRSRRTRSNSANDLDLLFQSETRNNSSKDDNHLSPPERGCLRSNSANDLDLLFQHDDGVKRPSLRRMNSSSLSKKPESSSGKVTQDKTSRPRQRKHSSLRNMSSTNELIRRSSSRDMEDPGKHHRTADPGYTTRPGACRHMSLRAVNLAGDTSQQQGQSHKARRSRLCRHSSLRNVSIEAPHKEKLQLLTRHYSNRDVKSSHHKDKKHQSKKSRDRPHRHSSLRDLRKVSTNNQEAPPDVSSKYQTLGKSQSDRRLSMRRGRSGRNPASTGRLSNRKIVVTEKPDSD